MYLRTPKRYTVKGSKRPLINLHWLWLYLLAPLIIIPAVLVWDFQSEVRQILVTTVEQMPIFRPALPTATPLPPLVTPDDDFASGHINKAVKDLEVLGAYQPNSVIVHSAVTQLLTLRSYGENKVMLAEAEQAGKLAINADPEAPDGWISMALALDWDGRYQEALGYALRARELDEKNPMVLVVMSEILYDLGKGDDALKMIDEGIVAASSAQPLNRAVLSHAHYVKAVMLGATSGQDAITEFEEAWRVAVSEPADNSISASYIAQFLATSYRSLGQGDQAVKILADAIRRDQDDPILPYQLARVYLNAGDRNKALTYAQTCHDLDPVQIRCLRLLASLYYIGQQYSLAIEMIQGVLTQNSTEATDYLNAGSYYSAINQCQSAISVMQAGLKYIDPDDTSLRAKFEETLRACGSTADGIVPVPAGTATEQADSASP